MAVWSKILQLTASCLSPLPGFEPQSGQVRKLPVTWGKAVVFTKYFGFLHYLQLANHDSWLSHNMAEKVSKKSMFQIHSMHYLMLAM